MKNSAREIKSDSPVKKSGQRTPNEKGLVNKQSMKIGNTNNLMS